jgi:hypothetical protein
MGDGAWLDPVALKQCLTRLGYVSKTFLQFDKVGTYLRTYLINSADAKRDLRIVRVLNAARNVTSIHKEPLFVVMAIL